MRQVHNFVYLAAKGEGKFKRLELVKRGATIEDGKSLDLYHLHYTDKTRFGTRNGMVNLYICGDEVQQAEAVDIFHTGDHLPPIPTYPDSMPMPTHWGNREFQPPVDGGFISEQEQQEFFRRQAIEAGIGKFIDTPEDLAEKANRI